MDDKVSENFIDQPRDSEATTGVELVECGDLLVEYLRLLGIEYVFGIPGGAIEPLVNALARSERVGGPKCIVARHESGAAFMADGYYKATGKLAVCFGCIYSFRLFWWIRRSIAQRYSIQGRVLSGCNDQGKYGGNGQDRNRYQRGF